MGKCNPGYSFQLSYFGGYIKHVRLLPCRRLAQAGHQDLVDDLVYDLLRKMAKGSVS